MPKNSDDQQPDALKLSRATMRKVNKVATGPLLGPVSGQLPKRVHTGELAARVAPLGSILAVRARMMHATEGEKP